MFRYKEFIKKLSEKNDIIVDDTIQKFKQKKQELKNETIKIKVFGYWSLFGSFNLVAKLYLFVTFILLITLISPLLSPASEREKILAQVAAKLESKKVKPARSISYSQYDFHSAVSDFIKDNKNKYKINTPSFKKRREEIIENRKDFLSDNRYNQPHFVENWRCVFKGDWYNDAADKKNGGKNAQARCHYPMTTRAILHINTWLEAPFRELSSLEKELKEGGGVIDQKLLKRARYKLVYEAGDSFPYFTYWLNKGQLNEQMIQSIQDELRSNYVLEFSGNMICTTDACIVTPTKVKSIGPYEVGMIETSSWWWPF